MSKLRAFFKFAMAVAAAAITLAGAQSSANEIAPAHSAFAKSGKSTPSPLAVASAEACGSVVADSQTVATYTDKDKNAATVKVFCTGPSRENDAEFRETVLNALATSQVVFLSPGVYRLKKSLRLPDGAHIIGAGSRRTTIKAAPAFDDSGKLVPFNMIILANSSSIEGVTMDGLYSESGLVSDPTKIVPGGGVLLKGNYSIANDVISTNQNGQAFAISSDDAKNPPHDNIISSSEGNNCGHRGMNIIRELRALAINYEPDNDVSSDHVD